MEHWFGKDADELDKQLYGSDLVCVHGPYIRKDNRKHVVLYYNTNKKKTVSYAKYLMEKHIGRLLIDDETVDHIDEDFTNDSIENLQILSREENAKKSVRFTAMRVCICLQCGKEFKMKERDYFNNQINKGKAGPFCGRSCAGRWSMLGRKRKVIN